MTKPTGNKPGRRPIQRLPQRCFCGEHWFSRTNKWGVILVSDGDQFWLELFAWTVCKQYATSWRFRELIRKHYLHQAIFGSSPDHRNGNGLDNRRSNLRLATQRQNTHNRAKPSTNTSGFKGVYFEKSLRQPWRAQIRVDAKCLHLGNFNTPQEAAHAYDNAARKHHGEFARLNFPDGSGSVLQSS